MSNWAFAVIRIFQILIRGNNHVSVGYFIDLLNDHPNKAKQSIMDTMKEGNINKVFAFGIHTGRILHLFYL